MQAAEPHRPEAGFTLLETIVALVILSAGLMAFYSFLVTMFQAADRLQAASIAYDRQANALELSQTINPMASPQGTFDAGTYHIAWTSERIRDERQSSRYRIGAGIFRVALYRMTFRFPDSRSVPPVEIAKLGYRRVGGAADRLKAQTQPPPPRN